jgi:hypothetical protein
VIWKSNGQHTLPHIAGTHASASSPVFRFPACSALCSSSPVPVGEFHQFDALADLAAIPDEIISLSIRIDPLNFHPG